MMKMVATDQWIIKPSTMPMRCTTISTPTIHDLFINGKDASRSTMKPMTTP